MERMTSVTSDATLPADALGELSIETLRIVDSLPGLGMEEDTR